MSIIQVLLTICIAALAIYMYVRLRSTLMDLILILLFFCVGVFFVLLPETTNDIAHWAGVGRGTDLLSYLAILFLFFLILKLYSRLRKLEQKLTEVVRNRSIEEAEKL